MLLSVALGIVALGAVRSFLRLAHNFLAETVNQFTTSILGVVDLATFSLTPEGLARLRTYTMYV